MVMYMKMASSLIVVALAVVLMSAPLFANAQADNALEATIRAAITSDSRTAQMSGEEIDQMVAALTQEASEQGITAQDIKWRPQEFAFTAVPEEEATDTSCGVFPVFFCEMGAAFGLDGSDVAIPIMLGITAGLLLFVIGAILHHRHGHHPVIGKLEHTVPSNPAPFAPPPRPQQSTPPSRTPLPRTSPPPPQGTGGPAS